MILLDTTVLVYAKGQDHEFRDPCRELIETIARGEIEATTTVEVIQEFVHIRARRRGKVDAAALGRDYAALLSPLVSPRDRDLEEGLALFERNDAIGAFDAVLAAVALNAGVDAMVSADSDFASVPGLAHVLPDRAGLSLLRDGPA